MGLSTEIEIFYKREGFSVFKRCLKEITDKQGSAMVMVIVVIVFLVTLGMAILSLSVTGLKVSLLDKKSNLSFYMAESGLEQAYEVILANVKGAIEAGNAVVAYEVEEFINLNGPESRDEVERIMLDPNDAKHQEWLKAFQDEYRLYLKYTLLSKLNDSGNYYAINSIDGATPPKISVEGSSIFDDLTSDTGYVTLSSEYDAEKFQNKNIPQTVRMTYNIQVPTSLPGTVQIDTEPEIDPPSAPPGTPSPPPETILSNPLYDQVLVSTNNIILEYANEKVDITGNVYGYSGFLLNKNNQQATINGNIVTKNNLQHNSSASGSTVYGNVYAHNIVTNSGTTGNTLKIMKNGLNEGGNAYTSGNLIALGNNNEIMVNGNWYNTDESLTAIIADNENESGNSVSYIQKSKMDAQAKNDLKFKQEQFGRVLTGTGSFYSNLRNYLCSEFFDCSYSVIRASGSIREEGESIVFPTPICGIPTNRLVGDPQKTNSKHWIEKLFWVDNTITQLFILGPDAYFDPTSPDAKWNEEENEGKVAVYVKEDFEGVIVSRAQVKVYGRINFKGLIISQDCILFSDPYDKRICNFDDAQNEIPHKVNEVFGSLPGFPRPFLSIPPAGREDSWPVSTIGDGTGGSTETGGGTGVSVTGSTIIEKDLNEDYFKELIKISDWEKLKK
jgi:hypothetical protein